MLRATATSWLLLGLLGLLGCAGSAPPSAPPPAGPPGRSVAAAGPSDPAPDGGAPRIAPTRQGGPGGAGSAAGDAFRPPFKMAELSEKDWLRGVREKLATRLKVEPETLFFTPSKQTAAVLRRLDDPTRKRRGPPPPRRYRVEVVDLEGKQKVAFRPITARGSDEPPKELRFLSEDRLVYEVVTPPPAPPPPAKARPARSGRRGSKRRPRAAARVKERAPDKAVVAEGPPPRLFVIQPIKRGARPLRCQGWRFTFVNTKVEERMAFVGGRPDAGFVSVNGTQVYPRKGKTIIASDPAWSRDGMALAFLETRSAEPPRLILLAEFDNPTGDTNWPLPASARLEGARVFWAGPGKLVVGKSALKPVFATSFERERPREFSP